MITLIRAVAVCTLSLFAGATHAQTGYPNRPVRVIVPFAPGGPSDVIARLLMQKFSENLGQQFYVENHAGVAAISAPRWPRARPRMAIPSSSPARAS